MVRSVKIPWRAALSLVLLGACGDGDDGGDTSTTLGDAGGGTCGDDSCGTTGFTSTTGSGYADVSSSTGYESGTGTTTWSETGPGPESGAESFDSGPPPWDFGDAETSSATGFTETSSSTTSGGEETGGEETGGGPEFPPIEPFGDDVVEPELVGTWSLGWDPVGVWDSILFVRSDGYFEIGESTADCSVTSYAFGRLWTEQTFLVMHVEGWNRPLPFPTQADIGLDFPPPFRMKLSYSLFGDNLSLTAPPGFTTAAPYDGRSYVRQSTTGAYLGGVWNGQAILEAIPEGADEPQTILIYEVEATLDAETGVDPEGTGTIGLTRYYYHPTNQNFYAYENGNWLDQAPGNPAGGAALMSGSRAMQYGPSFYGTVQMATNASGQTYKKNVDTDCP